MASLADLSIRQRNVHHGNNESLILKKQRSRCLIVVLWLHFDLQREMYSVPWSKAHRGTAKACYPTQSPWNFLYMLFICNTKYILRFCPVWITYSLMDKSAKPPNVHVERKRLLNVNEAAIKVSKKTVLCYHWGLNPDSAILIIHDRNANF